MPQGTRRARAQRVARDDGRNHRQAPAHKASTDALVRSRSVVAPGYQLTSGNTTQGSPEALS